MYAFDSSRAALVLESLQLSPINQRLARYWLSISHDGSLPKRADFNPGCIKRKLPGLAIFEANHNGTVVARLAGSAIDQGLGFSLVGKDFISYLPKDQQGIRVTRLHHIVSGFAGVGRTTYQIGDEPMLIEENLLLPFDGISETGSKQFLLHTNVRPQGNQLRKRPVEWNAGLPENYIEAALN